jgi:integrase
MAAVSNPYTNLDEIRRIIDSQEESMRFQDPKVQTRKDVGRPFYFIRPMVSVVGNGVITRKQKSIPLGFCDEISMKQAKAIKQERMFAINQGKYFAQAQIPFKAILQKYVTAHLPTLGDATQGKYNSHIENHIKPAFYDLRVCDIDTPTVQAWLNSKAEAGLSWATRTDLHNILSGIFTQAEVWKIWTGENPCHRAKVGKKQEVRQKRILDHATFQKFLAALGTTAICSDTDARLIATIAVVSGLRVSEVLGLQWGDIDFHARTLTVHRRWRRGTVAPPKSGNAARTRQIGSLADDLSEKRGREATADQWVFIRDGEPLDDRDLQQHVFRKTAVRLGIYFEGFGMHSFRRMNVTWRQEAGATPIEAQKAAGHGSLDMTMLYTVTDAKREEQQVEKILRRVRGTSTQLARRKVVNIA